MEECGRDGGVEGGFDDERFFAVENLGLVTRTSKARQGKLLQYHETFLKGSYDFQHKSLRPKIILSLSRAPCFNRSACLNI